MTRTQPIRLVPGPSLRGKPRGTLDVVYSVDAPHAAHRFEEVQGALLRGDIAFPEASLRLTAYLVAFDGVVTRESLVNALAACRTAYRWHGAVCIDWTAPCGRTDRRHLSVWSRFALSQGDAFVLPPGQAVEMLDRHFRQNIAARKRPESLDTFIADGQAWLALNLPGPWFSHAIGAVRLAALPRRVLARESAGRALSTVGGTQREPETLADDAIGLALDAYLGGAPDGGQWLVDEVMANCPENATRRTIVKNLLTVAAKGGGGRISSLILGWATDLAESGTPGNADISPRTVSKYVRAISRDLLDTFRGTSLERLKSEDFDAAYRKIISRKSAGNQRNCASALSSWHFFLETWVDAAPRIRSLHRGLPQPIPRANVLWRHEAALIAEWLGQTHGDSRLIDQTYVAFAIATSVRIRTNELIKLRVKNVRLIGNMVEIEICTPATDGGLKSSNARRVQAINCPTTAERVIAWKRRRLEELAMPNDYLFGDPHRPGQTYCHGQMQVLMNRLLKDATGDPAVSIHTLSHTWATEKFLEASRSQSSVDRNVFDGLSAEAGHGDASMTLANYVHRFEEAIRSGIDAALAPRLQWREVAPFVSINHDSYRQALSRRLRSSPNIDKGQCKLDLIAKGLPIDHLPTADAGVETIAATTSALRARASDISLGTIIDVLTDIGLGITSDAAALRASVSPERIVRIAHHARRLLSKLGEIRSSAGTDGPSEIVEELRLVLGGTKHGRIDFGRINQRKLLPVRNFLAAAHHLPLARDATLSWRKCYRYGYISLTRPSNAVALVKMLRQAGIQSSAIGIFHIPPTDAADAAAIRLQQEIDAVFVQEFALAPLRQKCSKRGGRPAAYFAIAGTDFTDQASSATLCMTGFNAVLLSACVFRVIVTADFAKA